MGMLEQQPVPLILEFFSLTSSYAFTGVEGEQGLPTALLRECDLSRVRPSSLTRRGVPSLGKSASTGKSVRPTRCSVLRAGRHYGPPPPGRHYGCQGCGRMWTLPAGREPTGPAYHEQASGGESRLEPRAGNAHASGAREDRAGRRPPSA